MEISGFENTSNQIVKKRIVPTTRNIFSIPLESYAYQPWASRGSYLSQWFNYDLNPVTWNQYAAQQIASNKTK